jgi:ABC-type polar amino acid transport system ATPase subunit
VERPAERNALARNKPSTRASHAEVTSALDPELKGEVLRVMRALAEEGMTMLVVTHELRFAREVADRVVFMEAGQVVEIAPPHELFTQPRSERTREFLGVAMAE